MDRFGEEHRRRVREVYKAALSGERREVPTPTRTEIRSKSRERFGSLEDFFVAEILPQFDTDREWRGNARAIPNVRREGPGAPEVPEERGQGQDNAGDVVRLLREHYDRGREQLRPVPPLGSGGTRGAPPVHASFVQGLETGMVSEYPANRYVSPAAHQALAREAMHGGVFNSDDLRFFLERHGKQGAERRRTWQPEDQARYERVKSAFSRLSTHDKKGRLDNGIGTHDPATLSSTRIPRRVTAPEPEQMIGEMGPMEGDEGLPQTLEQTRALLNTPDPLTGERLVDTVFFERAAETELRRNPTLPPSMYLHKVVNVALDMAQGETPRPGRLKGGTTLLLNGRYIERAAMKARDEMLAQHMTEGRIDHRWLGEGHDPIHFTRRPNGDRRIEVIFTIPAERVHDKRAFQGGDQTKPLRYSMLYRGDQGFGEAVNAMVRLTALDGAWPERADSGSRLREELGQIGVISQPGFVSWVLNEVRKEGVGEKDLRRYERAAEALWEGNKVPRGAKAQADDIISRIYRNSGRPRTFTGDAWNVPEELEPQNIEDGVDTPLDVAGDGAEGHTIRGVLGEGQIDAKYLREGLEPITYERTNGVGGRFSVLFIIPSERVGNADAYEEGSRTTDPLQYLVHCDPGETFEQAVDFMIERVALDNSHSTQTVPERGRGTTSPADGSDSVEELPVFFRREEDPSSQPLRVEESGTDAVPEPENEFQRQLAERAEPIRTQDEFVAWVNKQLDDGGGKPARAVRQRYIDAAGRMWRGEGGWIFNNINGEVQVIRQWLR